MTLLSQAFRRTMALSQGDVDEAVLFAKVTERLFVTVLRYHMWPAMIFICFNMSNLCATNSLPVTHASYPVCWQIMQLV